MALAGAGAGLAEAEARHTGLPRFTSLGLVSAPAPAPTAAPSSAPPAGVRGVTAPTTAPVAAPIPAPLTARSAGSLPQPVSSRGTPTASRLAHVLETIAFPPDFQL